MARYSFGRQAAAGSGFTNAKPSIKYTSVRRYHDFGDLKLAQKTIVADGAYVSAAAPVVWGVPALDVLTVPSMVEVIRSVFGLTAAQVAEVVGVSRPTLYNHLSDKGMIKDVECYIRAYNIAKAVNEKGFVDLKRGLKSVLVDGKSLLGYLKSPNQDVGRIIDVCKVVSERLSLSSDFQPLDISEREQRLVSRALSKSG